MNKMKIIEQINDSFDLKIRAIDYNGLLNERDLLRVDGHLFDRILNKTECQYGESMLSFSMTPDSYMKYKNGKYSSIIKGESGFKQHEGFEAVKIVNIVDSVFSEVTRYYSDVILSEFNTLTEQVFESINQLQKIINEQYRRSIDRPYLEELISYRDFFEDINDELGEISVSTTRSTAYVGSIIEIRKNSYKIYNHFVGKLRAWQKDLLDMDNRGYFRDFDADDLFNDYLSCRQTISIYTICLVYEHVISGLVDDSSKSRIIKKVKSFIERFSEADENIKQALNDRDYKNKRWYGYDRYTRRDSREIDWFLRLCEKDPEFEVSKINELFDKTKLVLNEIVIAPQSI